MPNNPVFSWGDNLTGALGINSFGDFRSSPVLVVGNHSFVQIASGVASLALKADGSAWAWGVNSLGSVGDGTTSDRSSPVLVVGNHVFIKIAAGGGGGTPPSNRSAAFGLKSDGSLWAWGSNANGRLGDFTETERSSPVLVVGNHVFTDMSTRGQSGVGRGFGLKADGSVWSWGYGVFGELGIGFGGTLQSSPVLVVGSHSFTKISAGGTNALALKADGSVWSWGQNGSGELGDNTDTHRASPVLVVGGHSFVRISAGANDHSIALKADGSVWSWGGNGQGQLGISVSGNRSSPSLVVGNHSFVEISTGLNSSFGLKVDGSAWAWGRNDEGQLGDNSSTSKSSPVLVVGGINFATLAPGDTHVLGIFGLPETGPGRFFSAF